MLKNFAIDGFWEMQEMMCTKEISPLRNLHIEAFMEGFTMGERH